MGSPIKAMSRKLKLSILLGRARGDFIQEAVGGSGYMATIKSRKGLSFIPVVSPMTEVPILH